MTQSIKEAYQEIPYPSYLHPQTHPDRFAAMAKFFGMNPTPIEKCRVLELGCGDGLGLMAFAFDLPESEFVGVDIAANHIVQGNEKIQEIGLKNIKLLEQDLMAIDDSFGKFDYIIAHGLIAWIPDFVREKVFSICSDNLTEKGVAYISYNAYPGCHIRQMIRGMMLYHTRKIENNIDKANQAASLIKFLAEIKDEHNSYRYALQTELNHYAQADIRNILFDDLGEANKPYYFHEFVSKANTHNLQYLSEVNYSDMQDFHLPENTRNMLSQIRGDIIRYIQYLDFIEGRRFHGTLICHQNQQLNRNPSPEIIKEFLMTSNAKYESAKPEIVGDKAEVFFNERGAKVATNNPLAKSALYLLVEALPRYVSFDELLNQCRDFIKSKNEKSKDEEELSNILFEVFGTGLIALHTHQPKLTTDISEKPLASYFARLQAKHLSLIPTLLCENLRMDDEFSLQLLEFLDGTRNREILRNEMKKWLESDDATDVFEPNVQKNLLTNLEQAIEENLQLMARKGLLVE